MLDSSSGSRREGSVVEVTESLEDGASWDSRHHFDHLRSW